MRIARILALTGAVLAGACGAGGEPAPQPVPAPTVEKVALKDWVDQMLASSADAEALPDTVADKPAIVLATDDPTAFDDLFPARSAATAE